jgi:hypothetical protein
MTKHATRTIIDRLEGNGYEWVCECGAWSPTGFDTYDEAWTDWAYNHARQQLTLNDETAPTGGTVS